MTIKEVANTYGTKSYIPAPGQTITQLVVSLYSSNDSLYYQILKELNVRTDWYNLDQVPVKYIEPQVVKNIRI